VIKIDLAKSAGFCFGVKRALNIAFATINSAAGADKIYMLGDIVHNEEVIRQIEKSGIKKIAQLSQGKNKTLLISAHGVGINTLRRAQQLGYKIVDATCPMVKEIHKIAAAMEKKGYQIIVIGDQQHNEVKGILGQLKKPALVIDRLENIPLKTIQRLKKIAVVVQSTQNLEKVLQIVAAIKPLVAELKFCNTICRPTRIKQAEIKTLPLQNDAMIIIGSKTSANTRRLYEISKSLNPRSYWIQSPKDIKAGWFKGAKSIGVTSGASTPDSTTQKVIAHLRKIT